MSSGMNISRDRRHYEIMLKILNRLKGNLKLLEVGSQDEEVRKYIPKNISYHSLDMYGDPDYVVDLNTQKIPVKDNTFDVMVCLETLEHTLYPKRIIKELKRVTKKDGLFILSMPNDYNFWMRINFLLGRKMKNTDEPFEIVSKFQHIHKPRVKDILNLFSENFRILKVIPLWQSRGGGANDLFFFFDKIIDKLSKFYPSLFARLIIVVAKNK